MSNNVQHNISTTLNGPKRSCGALGDDIVLDFDKAYIKFVLSKIVYQAV